MGLRGPQPLPTAVRIMNGNPSKRPLPENEPAYTPGVPDRPASMSAAAKKFWKVLIEQMMPTGVLRQIDGFALGDLCENMAELQELRQAKERKLASLRKLARAQRIAAAKQDPAQPQAALEPIDPVLEYAETAAGRRVATRIKELDSTIMVQRREFGLTPASNSRVEALPLRSGGAAVAGAHIVIDEIERALCVPEGSVN